MAATNFTFTRRNWQQKPFFQCFIFFSKIFVLSLLINPPLFYQLSSQPLCHIHFSSRSFSHPHLSPRRDTPSLHTSPLSVFISLHLPFFTLFYLPGSTSMFWGLIGTVICSTPVTSSVIHHPLLVYSSNNQNGIG